MKTETKNILSSLIKVTALVFSVVSITHSWFISQVRYTKQVEVTYADGSLSVADKKIDACLSDINGKAISSVSLDNMVPNSIVPFYINMGNTSSRTIHVSLLLSGISCLDSDDQLVPLDGSKFNLLTQVYFSSMAANGYQNVTSDITVPSAYYQVLSSDLYSYDNEVTYNKIIYSSFDIPANTDKDSNPAQLLCNFYFNSDAENDYKDLKISISKFILKVL